MSTPLSARPVSQEEVPSVSRWVPGILLEPSLRLYCLRAVLLFGIIDTWFFIWLYSLGKHAPVLVTVVVVLVTTLHHFSVALGPRLIPLPVWLDLGLTAIEAVYTVVLSSILVFWKNDDTRFRWFPRREAFGFVAFIFLAISLILLLALKIAHLASSPRGTSRRRVELGHSDYENPPWWKYGAQALFGRKPWEEKLPGEPRSILLTRGVLTLCVIVMLAMFSASEVILKPVAEMGMIPNREFRAEAIEGTFRTSTNIVWNLVLQWPTHDGATQKLIDAADVQILPSGRRGLDLCNKTERSDLGGFYQVVVFECSPSGEGTRNLTEGTDSYHLPDLLLIVNFLDLLDRQTPADNWGAMRGALQVFIGLTEDVSHVTETTRPIPVFPGVNLLSVANLIIRQRFKPAELATLGFDMYQTFFIADVKYTIPNPFLADHGNATNQMSTLRIVPERGSEEWVIVQDYRSKSVLSGLSEIGGLGSLLSTLFVIVLGSSLMRTLRGSKPYSPFGIVHNMRDGRDQIRGECMRRYPAMRAELEAYQSTGSRSQAGVTAFLLDTLFDAQALGFQGVPERVAPESEKVDTFITPTQAQSPEEQSGPLMLSYNPYTQA